MLQTNLIKILALLITIGTYTLIVYEKGCHDTEKKDAIISQKQTIANDEKIMELQTNSIRVLNDELEMAESTNKGVIDERNTITNEYNYQQSIIAQYQKKLNTTCNPSSLQLRIIKQITEPATYGVSTTTSATGTSGGSDRVATNSGILSWCIATREWGQLGWDLYEGLGNYYDNLRTTVNK